MGHLLSSAIQMQRAPALAATIEFDYYAFGMGYQYTTVSYNGIANTQTSTFSSGPITLSPTVQSIDVIAYDDTGMGVNIDYYINFVYQASYMDSFATSTPSITTSVGNAYYFYILTGAM